MTKTTRREREAGRSYEGPHIAMQELGATNWEYTVRILTDGTRTVAEVVDEYGDVIGIGHAVRRPGEKRNAQAGAHIAAGRALRQAGSLCEEAGEGML